MRVYPYGDPDNDWLGIDQHRGTISAGDYLSNDQTVGAVEISHNKNKKLQDKTNREGLIETGSASGDFVALLQSFLMYLRKGVYQNYRAEIKVQKDKRNQFNLNVEDDFDKLLEAIQSGNTSKAVAKFNAIKKSHAIEKNYLVRRAEATEDLAGVGLSVESASHDMMLMMGRAFDSIDSLTNTFERGQIDRESFERELYALRGMLSFINDQMNDVQLLFRSTKQRRRNIRVSDIVDKVEKIYRRLLGKTKIEFELRTIGSPLVVKTTDAVLLQVLINLFDNSIYWVEGSKAPCKILLVLDGDEGKLIFSDSGPGVREDDKRYIFEPFYSGKGEDGRGLGLYIARQLLQRHDFDIKYADQKNEQLLGGANFVVEFIEGV